MRPLAGVLLAVLTAGSASAERSDLAVTIVAAPLAHSCAVTSTATIVAYDVSAPREIAYRFVRSDGSVTPTARLALAGDGTVAQSVRDNWLPHGAAPWTALEIVSPERVRSPHAAVAARCARGVLADR